MGGKKFIFTTEGMVGENIYIAIPTEGMVGENIYITIPTEGMMGENIYFQLREWWRGTIYLQLRGWWGKIHQDTELCRGWSRQRRMETVRRSEWKRVLFER